jgi:plastocyanin
MKISQVIIKLNYLLYVINVVITYNMKTVYKSTRMIGGISILFMLLFISGSCSKSSTPKDTPGTNEVLIQDMAFDPVTLTISANTTVTWTNKDPVAHTVTSNTGVFDSGNIQANKTFSHLFDTPGNYPYHCIIHPSMTGTVIVN